MEVVLGFHDTVNPELKHILIWFKINKLSLNTLKTDYIIFKNLTWKEHITEVEKNISKNIRLLYRAKNNFGSNELCILYISLVLPYLQYSVHMRTYFNIQVD